MTKTKSLIRVALLALAVTTMAPLFAQSTGGFSGKAIGNDGKPLAGYLIVIQNLSIAQTWKTKTNKKGHYVYIGLPIGGYKITLEDPSGKSVDFVNNIKVEMGAQTMHDFNLAKEAAEQAKANPEAAKEAAQAAAEKKQFSKLSAAFNQAVASYNAGNYAQAAASYQEALPLAKGPKNQVAVLSNLAMTYDKAKLYDKAIATFKQALQVTPNNAALESGLGGVYSDQGDVKSAMQAYEKAAQMDPAHAGDNYFNMGVELVNRNQMDDALEAFKKCIQADPTNADAYYWEGQALLSKATMSPENKIVPAPGTIEAYQKYLNLAPTGPYAASAKQILQTLSGNVQTQYNSKRKKRH